MGGWRVCIACMCVQTHIPELPAVDREVGGRVPAQVVHAALHLAFFQKNRKCREGVL